MLKGKIDTKTTIIVEQEKLQEPSVLLAIYLHCRA